MNSNRQHCIQQLSNIFSSKTLILNIEKSIFNNSLSYANKYDIEKNWSNKRY